MLEDYKKITQLSDTINIPVTENGERMVSLSPDNFKIEYKKLDMIPLFGNKVFVREQVSLKLEAAQSELKKINKDFQLLISYGYRTPEIQESYFNAALERAQEMKKDLSEEEYLELAHSMSAHTKSAGHTVGGAVDLTIWDSKNNIEIDMGSKISEFGDIAYTLYPHISENQKENRLLLQKIMMNQGFAPFLGEWWHFSFGDKEWAFYYKQPSALYDVVNKSNLVL
ncbi:MAG: M15 family metallopeptidase [bacterium]